MTLDYVPFLKEEFSNRCQFDNWLPISTANIILDENKDPFRKFATEFLRFGIYESESGFKQPNKFLIGTSITFNGPDTSHPKSIPRYGMSFPIEHNLRTLLELPGVFESVLKFVSELYKEKRVISNFMQGNQNM